MISQTPAHASTSVARTCQKFLEPRIVRHSKHNRCGEKNPPTPCDKNKTGREEKKPEKGHERRDTSLKYGSISARGTSRQVSLSRHTPRADQRSALNPKEMVNELATTKSLEARVVRPDSCCERLSSNERALPQSEWRHDVVLCAHFSQEVEIFSRLAWIRSLCDGKSESDPAAAKSHPWARFDMGRCSRCRVAWKARESLKRALSDKLSGNRQGGPGLLSFDPPVFCFSSPLSYTVPLLYTSFAFAHGEAQEQSRLDSLSRQLLPNEWTRKSISSKMSRGTSHYSRDST